MIGISYFADQGCTTPLGASSCTQSQAVPSYINVYTTTGTGCGATTKTILYNRGAQYTGTVYDGSPAACTALSSTSTATSVFYSVGSPVDLTMFQAGSYGYQ